MSIKRAIPFSSKLPDDLDFESLIDYLEWWRYLIRQSEAGDIHLLKSIKDALWQAHRSKIIRDAYNRQKHYNALVSMRSLELEVDRILSAWDSNDDSNS